MEERVLQEERASSTDTVFQGAGWDEEGRRRQERARTKSETRGKGVEEGRPGGRGVGESRPGGRGLEESRPPSREGVIDLLRGNSRRPLEVGREQSTTKLPMCEFKLFRLYTFISPKLCQS